MTDRETTQPNLRALEYWATGLTPAYLEGALDRALEARPKVLLRRLLQKLEADAACAREEADLLRRAALAKRRSAEAAEQARDVLVAADLD